MRQAKTTFIGAAIGMLLLILDGKTAISGAQDGIELCIRTVIPSLFPFFVLSILLTSSFSGLKILRPLGRLFRISPGSESILLTGLLGGYPVGAQAVTGAYASGQLSKGQANRMLAFCNQAGPSFLFGIVAAQFPDTGYGWLLWGIQLLSAYLVSLTIAPVDNRCVKTSQSSTISVSDSLRRSISVMAFVCGWIVLFRVVIAFSERWFLWLLPETGKVVFMGILELTNGCCSLPLVADVNLRLALCSGMLSLGGLCVLMQTVSVIGELDKWAYIRGKLLQAVFSSVISFLIVSKLAAAIPLILVLPALFRRKTRKRSGNPDPVGV